MNATTIKVGTILQARGSLARLLASVCSGAELALHASATASDMLINTEHSVIEYVLADGSSIAVWSI